MSGPAEDREVERSRLVERTRGRPGTAPFLARPVAVAGPGPGPIGRPAGATIPTTPRTVNPPPTEGGCEGNAMLNRNNLTLSALSNRLNLGTRSLVLQTSVNNGTALRIRHPHHDVMREPLAVFQVGDPFVVACAAPPITEPATPDASRPACDPGSSADASWRPSRAWQTWRDRQDAVTRARRTPASRSRRPAAPAAAVATSPRLGRGPGKGIGKAGAAGAAGCRTATTVAYATDAGS